jgi:hypothetical protein
LYASSTFVENVDEDQKEIDILYNLCEKKSTRVFIGGTGFDQLDHSHPVVVRRLHNFEDVNTY